MTENAKLLDYLKKVTADLYETRERLRKMEAGEQEPVAVVGMGCRFAGGVRNPEDLWDLMAADADAVSGFPADRGWVIDGPDDFDPRRQGGFVYDATDFDANFFGISPREALAMDPQQRMFLEVAWEAIEHSAIDPLSLRGSSTGVFVGAASSGYGSSLTETDGGSEGYLITGNASAVVSGRLSYVLGLEGPAVTVDTACSSSLVALHLACGALRAGECSMALAGGVAVMVTPGAYAEFDRQDGLASDGRCKAFAGGADGIGWGEGAGVLVLERLSEARRKGHRILAVVRGSAINQDGASNGLTAPNGPSQQRVIRAALADARLSALDVDAVEAHGTGTTLGDPIEAQALLTTYGQERPDDRPLWVGSVKSNIGHTQCAAGVAGVIKSVLSLTHGVLPATLHVDVPTPEVDWSAGRVEVLQEARPWPGEKDRVRRVGVSAFGVSGTNVHAILEEASSPTADDAENGEDPGQEGLDAAETSETGDGDEAATPVLTGAPPVWLVSGRTAGGMAAQAGRLRELVVARPELDPADVAWSLISTRSTLEHRAVVLGGDRDELVAGLAAVAAGAPSAGVVSGIAGDAGRVVFVFPGQGSQWIGMGRELAASSPVFAARLAECAEALAPYVGWSLQDVLAGAQGAPGLGTADVVQPVLWAVMVSLAAVWEAAGVEPDAVVGHSQGEIAAACVAGILSLEDAAKVVALRSKALTVLAGRGGMLSIAEPADKVRERLSVWGERLSVAAVNGPAATVVSGEPDALAELAALCAAQDVRNRLLPVDYASHHAQIEGLKDEILSVLEGIVPGRARVPMVSAMTGAVVNGPELDASYWYASLRATVEFDRAIRVLGEGGHQVFIEVSPHPVLTSAITDALDEATPSGGAAATVTGTLRRDDGGPGRLLAALAGVHVRGTPVRWTAVVGGGERVDLPTYAFQRQRFWPDTAAAEASPAGGDGAGTVAEARFWAAVEGGDVTGLADALGVDGARLGEVMPALTSWRRRDRVESAAANWRYRVSWIPVGEPGPVVLSGTWLVVVPAGRVADDLAEGCVQALTDRGAHVAALDVAPGMDRAALAVRLAEAASSPAGDGPVAGIVSLLGVDEDQRNGVAGGLSGTLALVQALGDAEIGAPLWTVTRGAVAVGDEPAVGPVQAQVWGLGRVAALEHPDRWGGLIDVPAVWDERIAAGVSAVLAGCGEDQTAVRGAGIMARRLVRMRRPRTGAGRWTPRGGVLITGGTGGVGGHVARWLTGRGARRTVLTSRSGPGAAGAAALAAELAAAGTAVDVVACDTARRSDVAGLLAWTAARAEPLTSVFHAAGAGDGAVVDDTTDELLSRVGAAKAMGAAHLDELTVGLDLDAFVLFSSGAAVWGSGGLAGYAAANAFLDGLAENRRARGLPATSVAWGLWGGAGMGAGKSGEQLRRLGMRAMDPAVAVKALGQVLDGGETLAVVADLDWARFAPVFTLRRSSPLLGDLPEARQALAAAPAGVTRGADGAAGSPLAERLAGLPRAEQDRMLTDLVRDEAAAVLGHRSSEEVEPGRAFRDMGFDSLTAVELRNRLAAATGLSLPSTLVFDHPSAVAVARLLGRELLGGPAGAGSPATPVAAAAPDEPIAIVGMGCRYPGGVDDPEGLWDLVAAGRDAIAAFPEDRGWEALERPDGADSDGSGGYAREGGFVPDAVRFDAAFFGISPREALAMDPQQRLLLETTWEALEQAGIDPVSLRGSATGVFAGAAFSGYATEDAEAAGYRLTGGLTAVISGRVSYTLGLEGPAVTVDTACSSSLVALHLACQSLRSGECTLALAGGVAVLVTPGAFAEFSHQQGMAADGRCKPFAAAADGIGWGEGAGMVVLERLSDARRNGHHVLAVVRGSAINQDGASNGLAAPNGPSQQRVIRAALANAQVAADEVDMVEAHGTGTTLGDPIEAQALLATYGRERAEDRPLRLGSVKSNIGHTGAAAGAAGIIKTVLALRHRELPGSLHVDAPTPHVDWSAGRVELLTEKIPWPRNGYPRRAGVSAFGVSGTNVHVVLEEVDDAEAPAADGRAATPAIGGPAWTVSARTAEGLAAQAARLARHLADRPELDPADVGWSLATTRSVFEHRAVVTGANRDGLLAGLEAVAAGRPAAGVVTGTVPAGRDTGRVAFVFPGQGSQWIGMGRELASSSPVFAARLAECSAALAPYVDWSLTDVLAGADGAPGLETADVVQPVLWAVMVSLAAVWESAGVRPDAVVGHSQGEIAAACVAGILSLQDAARVVALRSQALTALAGRGGMLSVADDAERVRDRLAAFGERLSIAAVNGPAATVVSGEPAALEELGAACASDGVRTRLLPVDYASHHAQVESLEREIVAVLAGITPGPARVPMVSAMTGEFLDGPELDAAYWYASLRASVEFDRAVRVLAEGRHRVFIEASPHPVLTSAITGTLEALPGAGAPPVVTGTLRRDDGGTARLLLSLAEVHVSGTDVDWTAVLPAGRRVELPTYAFQRQRYWPQTLQVAGDVASAGLGATGHPLLGAAVELAGGTGLVFTGRLSPRVQPWLADHAVAETVVLPGTAFVELAVRAGYQAGCPHVEELTLAEPLVLPDGGAVQIQVSVSAPGEDGRRSVEVHSRAEDAVEGPWTSHAAGRLGPATAVPDADAFAVWPPPGAEPVDVTGMYDALAGGGYGYGPAFQGLRAAWRRGDEVFAQVALPEDADAGAYGLHPALLDAALHAAALTGRPEPSGEVLLPFVWNGVALHAAGASVLRVRLRQDAAGAVTLDAADATGAPVASVASLVFRPVAAGRLEQARSGVQDALFAENWVTVPIPDVAPDGPWVVVGPDPLGLAAGLAEAGVRVQTHPDLAALAAALDEGEPAPELVLTALAAVDGPDPAEAARLAVADALELVQNWLDEERFEASRLVLVSRGAVAARPGEGVADLPAASAWGLVRSAQSENPGRLVLADLPRSGGADVLAAALGSAEPELAVRDRAAYGRRLGRPAAGLVPPAGGVPWRLDVTERGTLDALALVPAPQAAAPLAAGQVRVAVRAAGLNFRDVLIGLDMYPDAGEMGTEVAGIVAEVGPGVTGLAAGDRVLGAVSGGFGPLAVTDARLLVPIPEGWSFAAAASVPIAFVTAWYALVDLGGAAAGQRLLVHSAAGGVGMAAVAIGRHLGLEVFGTASPGKHPALTSLGLDAAHVASSRTAEFEERFLSATGGQGMDLVLNALAGELTDASLRLLPRGGAFLELGKTDVRDAERVAADHPGVVYRPFETADAGTDRFGEILARVTGLLAADELPLPPVRAWDVRRAPEALRFMSRARHVGKIVLTVPPDPAAARPGGTVLITGGTGVLGGLVARHLAGTDRARGVVLAGRSGPAAPGVAALAADLAAGGAAVKVTACDAADGDALAAVLDRVAAEDRLTGVVHAAGVLDDGVIGSLSADRVDTVMRPKADAAWNLHRLTAGLDLDTFVLFSSAAATFGGAGQGNYAAANAFLDALAARRRAAGLPAVSLAWGYWADATGMTGHLGTADVDRMNRTGVTALAAGEGLALLDLATSRDEAHLVPARLDVAGLRAKAARGADVPALWRGLAGAPVRSAAVTGRGADSADRLRGRLAALTAADQDRTLLDLVRAHVAAVLGHASPDAVEPGRAFNEIGFDSLTAVELRNRLHTATGLRLPATLVFDHPNPAALAGRLRTELLGRDAAPVPRAPAVRAAEGEPIAIVAMGCRFPGGVQSPDDLWDLLGEGRDAISGFPADRGWDLGGVYDPDPDHPGTSYTVAGGFVDGAGDFDPGFFGISPREALAMDPQQRLVLEVSWEALERAGIVPGSLRGSPTGVFVGAAFAGYGAGLQDELAGHLLTGTASSVLSGRVSYLLGLEGPAVTVDTACSSSLVALHLAAQSLRSGDCSLALAGGVMVMASPAGFVGFSRQRGLAADGRCKAFGASADGMGMAEGAGMLVLERLSDARRNGHRVLAVVTGSAVNQDGASNGLTAPNGPSQQRVIRAALDGAELSAADIDAVEAHGTGTTLGDPIEAQALLATYGQDRPDGRPLWLGSVKSNIGHTQAAAGVAGVIKMVLALRHRTLPATLHADEPSPHVDWSAGAVSLLTEPVPWPAGDRPRRAGISSFGFSGTNAHTILEEPPADEPADARPGGASAQPPEPLAGGRTAWMVSARTPGALAAQAGRLREFVASCPDLDPADVAWSLVTTRSMFDHRAVVTGADHDELLTGLTAVAAGEPAAGVVSGVAGDAGRVVFVFPGQGSQWIGMGRELASSSPVFAARLAECAAALAPHVDWSLQDVLAGADGAPGLETADVVQPALWAVMVSLAAVWEAAGVRPDAVVGHSQGEIAAACVAGILSLQDAAKVVALRSKALTVLAGHGGMLSVAESAEQVRDRLAAFGERLSIAAVNGPTATVVSGEPAALEELVAACASDGVRTRLLPVDYASHSAQVERLEREVPAVLAGITPGPARVPMVSAMTGEFLDGPELDAAYWYASLRATVEFDRAIRVLGEAGHRAFVEVSPHPVLTTAITDTLEAAAADGGRSAVLGTLRRDDGGTDRLLTSLAEASTSGIEVEWTAVLGGGRTVDLPTYAFQHRTFWPQPDPAPASTGDGEGAGTASEARFWTAVENEDVRALADTLAVDDRRLRDMLPVLASWRRRERDESLLRDWRYQISWTPVTDPGRPVLPGTWLAVLPAGATAGDLPGACVQALNDSGADVLVVETGPDAPDRAALAERIARSSAEANGARVAGVMSLLPLDETPLTGHRAVTTGVAGTLVLLQALGDAGIEAPLWVVTSGAVAAGPGEVPVSPVQAQAWGLGRVAGLEHPDRWGGLVDLPSVLDDRAAARLCAVLAGCGEDQVAVRPSGILARRLVRATPRRNGDHRWTPRGSVLVTGATGAIGPHLARWLARCGAPNVVLTSRRGTDIKGGARLAAELAAAGTTVGIVACDVAERDQVAGLLDWVDATGPALSTVMHAAVALRLTPLDGVDLHELSEALGAKVDGARWLDELTADQDLDAFVLFSSIAATWGGSDHGAYAAANAHLDALAMERRSRGLPATSVAWGVWDTREPEDLDAELPPIVTWLLRQGMGFLDPAPALTALGQVLADDETFLAVADVDWTRYAPVFTAARPWPLLDGLPEVKRLAVADATGPDTSGEAGELTARLAAVTPAERERVVADLVRVHAAAVLGHASPDEVGATRAFRDMGFDSLTAVELRNRLNAETGLKLPSTAVFDYPSPQVLARQVITELLGVPAETASAPARPVAATDEPVAIVGMGCRYPGGAGDPDRLWDLLARESDATSPFPVDRGWELDGLIDADPDRAGTSYTSRGGFVLGATEFDPGFFGISPREALAMDPQQRLLLETAWEALERAGIDPLSLRGTSTGVFAGASSSGYLGRGAGMEGAEGHLVTGNSGSVISGRVSYVLGLEGPAVTVDTACSSSLVALHLACQAVRSGECGMALAGGVAVMADPAEFVGFSRQRVLAADGRCKAFGASADGMGLAEGAGMVLVERLSDALRNGHPVLAVVRGSAINQDGASNGLTAPNGPSQQRVIRAALANARLTADQVDAVEGHGTGTELGDPIEAQALLATYGQDRPDDRPLWLGSIKSNIGHAQAAAGVAGIIKMVLALRHGLLPRTLHADEPTPHVDWSSGAVRLLNEAMQWSTEGAPRRAGVSAFGISGTNAHIILEEPPAPAESLADVPEESPVPVLMGGPVVWPLSARTAGGLAAQAGRLREFVMARPDLDPVNVGWSLVTTRSAFEHRAVVTGDDPDELMAGLTAVAAGEPAAGAVSGLAGEAGRVVFVFPGQGSQWIGMGRELTASSPVFAARLAECAAALAPFVDWSLQDVLAGVNGAPGLETADVVQPVLWAVMVSLAAVWEAAGVQPDAVVGHSQGEIAAACVAGILSLEDAAKVVALRSKALTVLAGRGGMLSIAEPAGKVRERLSAWGDRLSVAAVNGPAATVVSGEPNALQELAAACEAESVRNRLLPVDYASHSAQVEAIEQEIRDVLKDIAPGRTRLPMVSAMTGEFLDGPELDASYWYASLRAPVEFDRAIRVLAEAGHRMFIETSPHPVLTAPIIETLEAVTSDPASTTAIGTLRRDDGGADRLLTSLAEAYTAGASVEWTSVLPAGERVDLPTYAFQRERFWPEPITPEPTAGGGEGAEADFWAAVEDGDVTGLAEALAVDDQRLSEVLPALASWRRQERDAAAVSGWRYRVSWVPVPESEPVVLSGTWLLIAPTHAPTLELLDGTVQAMSDRGARVVVVEAAPDDADRAVFAGLIDRVLEADGRPDVAGVVSLLALEEAPLPGFPVVAGGLAGTVALVQALGDLRIDAPLWAVTRGAVSASDEPVESAVQAQVWGLGRVAGLEHPDRWGGLVDMPPVWDERVAARLCAALAGAGEDQLAIRASGSMARRLTRAPRPRDDGRRWSPRGTVLVTGGTGGVGGHVARWLAGRGASKVVLVSRSGPAAAGVAELAARLAERGVRAEVVAGDTGRRNELAGLLDRIAADGPPLSAVLHAAGSGQATPLRDLDREELAAVLSAKATGAALLDELTSKLDLDAFVLFSSGAATWGSGGQSAYAAANAFLDALAEARRARGLVGSSVAWGLWGGGGMGSGEGGDQLQRLGMRVMNPDLAVGALGQVLDADEGPVTVADVDWTRFTPVFTLHRPSPLIADLPEVAWTLVAAEGEPEHGGDGAGAALAERLAGRPRAEQERALVTLVRAEATAVLGHRSSDAVAPGRAFRDLGFDSLTAVELRNRLTAATGRRLPATVVFDHPTPAALAGRLRAEMFGDDSAESSVPAELDRLESILSSLGGNGVSRFDIALRLEAIAQGLRDGETSGEPVDDELETATDEEMFDLVEKELGTSDFD
ncbi:type I polyketide synthase [Actinomadura violacea]|nr:SDR family NAD(P)-dependent oxidoreductase [Actinomadura violacea]